MTWFSDTDWFRDERVLSDKESIGDVPAIGVTEHAHSCSTVYDVGPTLNQTWPMYSTSLIVCVIHTPQ